MIFTDQSGMYQYYLSSQISTVRVAIVTTLYWQPNYIIETVNFNIKFSIPFFHNTIPETCHFSVCIFQEIYEVLR